MAAIRSLVAALAKSYAAFIFVIVQLFVLFSIKFSSSQHIQIKFLKDYLSLRK